MSMAAIDSSFFSNLNPLTSTFKPTRKSSFFPASKLVISSSRNNPDDQKEDLSTSSSGKKNENQLAKLAVVTLAAGVLAMGSVNGIEPAFAAKSGGRIGGQAFKSAPRASSPRINNNSRTNIYVNPPVAPPLIGGYGYGGYSVPFYGGWGWSPFSFFAPGPSVAVGVGGGFEFFFLLLVLGAVSTAIRRFFSSREDDMDDY
ncbi:OLC1v1035116C1 [Oldenlandia corymbosa var. corymbosa]|uniref:OLC1v1035116C1 n=1 Tax=Oldenlandia corymbosa var. corymbosa TaxID=529605 RepID=A0AAV1CSZ5_OLDCO|nr:OLC1v1035116C1 [Oldenlandia corymbosa var. corymbosa]